MAHLHRRALGIRINITSVSAHYADHLRRAEATLAVMPQEVMDSTFEFSAMPLFEDSYVAPARAEHPEVGERLTRQQMSELPYVMFDPPGQVSIVEKQMDDHGIKRNTEVSTTSMLAAPFLLPAPGCSQ
ncbi:hypothetical protein AQJ46_43860 [Streptomyces canus]|uniref:LysR substrate-binding domain-containing protein n=1 Tax=Streptomyces canus TaxID=58343 RepID=A0A101RM64_9ACTN|nr:MULTISPECIES: LysR substrate-binding domain-containing protein [Streptomyces]KUN58147.1 hypothetical protein AQJ46_43860 [Streptomyces canus]MDI5904770.1 LysR substrate-binding domain-containing protein [Streptomyces sp. 12257]